MEVHIYALLNTITELTALVNGNIRPIAPSVNQTLPHAWYTLAASPTTQYLRSPSDRTPYTLTVTVHAFDLSQISAALDATKLAINGYTDPIIKAVFFTGQSEGQDEREVPFRSQTYSVWG